VAPSKTSIVSSSKVNSPSSIKPAEEKRNIIDELDKIMENLDLKNCWITQIWNQREILTASSTILKRTSPPVMAMSPTALR
jgi:hypothetical protein